MVGCWEWTRWRTTRMTDTRWARRWTRPNGCPGFARPRRMWTRGIAERRRLQRRSAIEPVIGHMKSDCRMNRNYLKGSDGDRMNAMLAGAGFNFRKLLRAFAWAFFRRFRAWLAEEKTLRSSPTFLGLYQKTIETTA